MKAIIIAVLSVLLAAVLVVGNIHWGKSQASSSHAIKNSSSNIDNSIDSNYYLNFADAWPEGAQTQFETKLKNNETYHIVLLGSEAIGNTKTGLLPNLKEALTDTYEKYVSIENIVYKDTSSNYVLNDETKKLIKQKPDMIIFEPFLLADNNVVDIYTTLANISTIIKETKEELPNATFILQPANQIYNASLYPTQVAALKGYAEKEGITYLDHWENWPDGKSKEVLDYINSDGTPNEKGYEIWSNYITDFLIKK